MKKIELAAEVSEESCPHCGKNLIYKYGRFGRFLACPGYPDCKFTKNIVRQTGVPCPLDGGMLVERRSKKEMCIRDRVYRSQRDGPGHRYRGT